MKKKITIILALLLVVFAACFIYLKFFLLKAKDFKPDNSKARSAIDLRPSIIAKLQQLVKDGSDGLYVLSIEKIDPDIVGSTLDVFNASLRVDTTVMQQLDHQKKLPDDIFLIHFDSLHITGIGIDYLLHSKTINVTGVEVAKPTIEVYHKAQLYNKAARDHNDTMSLYHQIREQLNAIKVGHININQGTLVIHDGHKQKNVTRLNEVDIRMNDLLLDSSTQYATDRFLFAKQLDVVAKHYITATADSLYYFKTGALSISAAQHKMVMQDVELEPRGNKQQFESKLKYRQEMFHLLFKKVTLDGVDWWSMINREKFMATDGEITGGSFSVYVDRTLPSEPGLQVANFPQQTLMKLSMSVAVHHLALKDVDVSYEEFNPSTKQAATAYFDKLNGQLNYASNMPEQITQHPVANFSANGLFMHNTPMKAAFTFDLSKHKTGEFTTDLEMEAVSNETINTLSEPLGLFLIKSGEMQKGVVHIEGNNLSAKCNLSVAYSDLHVDPLKTGNESDGLKKKRVSAFFANVFLIKNSNPEKGKPLRQPAFTVSRDHHGNFFNLLWITTMTGILKTIGVPVKLVIH